MDKETLSNYGWIVICVLVLAVMIALASPFGKFVSDAVKNTTAGLFGVNQEALGAAGIVIDDQAFCDHTNTTTVPAGTATEEHPAHDAYTVCADCGKVMTADGEIPYAYTEIGANKTNMAALYDGTLPNDLVIPETFYNNGTWYKVVSIGYAAFYNCDNLTSVIIPNSVTSIGSNAFAYSEKLTSITIPDSVTSIGDSAFTGCTNLTSITIPDSITSMGSLVFYQCTNLTSVTIGKSVTNIGIETFKDCTKLSMITISNSVVSIGKNGFNSCDNLTAIIFNGTIDMWNTITKGIDWNYDAGNYTIHCTDGHIHATGNGPKTESVLDSNPCLGDSCPLK